MPTSGTPAESSLLLVVSEADDAVAVHRTQYDLSARVGIPAHFTIAYPSKPTTDLDIAGMSRLRTLCVSTPSFTVELATTSWFGTDVLFPEPRDVDPIVRLIRSGRGRRKAHAPRRSPRCSRGTVVRPRSLEAAAWLATRGKVPVPRLTQPAVCCSQ